MLTYFRIRAQLPRPRWIATSSKVSAYWLASPSGVLLRRFTLAIQGFVIVRQDTLHSLTQEALVYKRMKLVAAIQRGLAPLCCARHLPCNFRSYLERPAGSGLRPSVAKHAFAC